MPNWSWPEVGDRVVIAGMGAVTAVGRGAWESAAAVRAGISGFSTHPYMIDTAGEPMRVALAPWLDIDIQGVDRFEALLMPAIEEALAGIDRASDSPVRCGLALGLPEPRPGLPDGLAWGLKSKLSKRFGGVFGSIAIFEAGNAAAVLGLQAAHAKLAIGALDMCVVTGVDSWLAPVTLEWLETSELLHSAGIRPNPWGFIPGEGAAALLLAREGVLDSVLGDALALLLGIGYARESRGASHGTVCTGEGLTTALRGALDGLPQGWTVAEVYGDLNGEPNRADEFGFTVLRTRAQTGQDFSTFTPADCVGDLGAASAAFLGCVASIARQADHHAGRTNLFFAGSRGGGRGAAAIQPLLSGRAQS